jgi:hypothetical protein
VSINIIPDPAAHQHADHVLCGLRVRSDLPLPELLAWTGDDRAVDIHIRLATAPLPNFPAAATSLHPLFQVAPDGQSRFALPAVATYLVAADGREVTIAPVPGVDDGEVRLFLFGTVFAIICHRLGLLPLHACCVQVGDKAVAFAGDSGAGKSTLAAGLWKRGFPLLADDITVIDMAAPGGPVAIPAFARIKLWRDSLEAIGQSVDGLQATRPTLDKYHFPLKQGFCTTPLRLAKLVLLTSKHQTPSGFEPLPAMLALSRLGQVLYRPRLMLRLGTQAQQTNQYLNLLADVGGLSLLHRPETPAEWDHLETALRTMGG